MFLTFQIIQEEINMAMKWNNLNTSLINECIIYLDLTSADFLILVSCLVQSLEIKVTEISLDIG